MSRSFVIVVAQALTLVLFCLAGSTRAGEETLLLQQPTVSQSHIVFQYAGDLWIVGRDGGDARRLTSDAGVESDPRLSPDGQWVAFTGQYEGNSDVYVLSIDGGRPQRLTWHPGRDVVRDWHPDGQKILFTSGRESHPMVEKAFLVSKNGGMPTALPLPRVNHANYNHDGSKIVYTPYPDAFRTWKRYRGGRVAEVWIYDTRTHDVEVVPHVNASDTFPCWHGGDVFYASDRDRQMNIWKFTPGATTPTQITHFTDFDVRNMSSGGGVVVFEQAGALHEYDPTSNRARRLHIRVRSDGLAARPRWQPARGFVRSASIAPNGKRAVFEARGEIISMPREHGDARNLTNSPGEHDRSPIWSPDGSQVAWFSDHGGEYKLHVADRLGREDPTVYALGDGGFYYSPVWSPDGKHVMFNDKFNRTSFVTLENGDVTEVVANQGSLGVINATAVWSPDSRWIAFEHRNPTTSYDRVRLFSLDDGTSTSVTDAFAYASSPAFSRDGKHLFFAASVDVGPRLFGLDMNTSAVRASRANLYVAVLQEDGANPLAPRSDEAVSDSGDKKDKKDKKNGDERKEDGNPASPRPDGVDDRVGDLLASAQEESEAPIASADDAGEDTGDDEAESAGDVPSIDLDGLDQRILALPIASSNFGGLACSDKKLLFLEFPTGGTPEIKSFDFKDRKVKSVKKGVRSMQVSADGKWILARGSSFEILPAGGGKSYSLGIDAVQLRVDPAAEWPQTLREAWRFERDYFYDENMHGVDWPAMWDRWSVFLPHVQHRADLNLIMGEMIGELACGHNYVGGGEMPRGMSGVPTGLLGADFEADDKGIRIAKILTGQNWNPGNRAPLTEPGVDVDEGDYIISVNGRPVEAGSNIFSAFANTSGKQVELKVSAQADGRDARTSTVVPIRSDASLRRNQWIEENRRRVDELSGGRLAYIFMQNTGGPGRAAFDRDFYSQIDKEGLVLDERFNRGGKVADYVIDVLSRKVVSYWMNREHWLSRSPFATIDGPKVMIINERAGSGGDWMPWAFQKNGVGKLVGRRTWGGLVGTSGYPPLMDGGRVTAASFGVMDTEGKWAVENVGIAPDYEVTQWPKDVIAGGDPQLEKAVEVALDELSRRKARVDPTYYPPSER